MSTEAKSILYAFVWWFVFLLNGWFLIEAIRDESFIGFLFYSCATACSLSLAREYWEKAVGE